jgi:hypothetical protein
MSQALGALIGARRARLTTGPEIRHRLFHTFPRRNLDQNAQRNLTRGLYSVTPAPGRPRKPVEPLLAAAALGGGPAGGLYADCQAGAPLTTTPFLTPKTRITPLSHALTSAFRASDQRCRV